jgi:hypothetical protein
MAPARTAEIRMFRRVSNTCDDPAITGANVMPQRFCKDRSTCRPATISLVEILQKPNTMKNSSFVSLRAGATLALLLSATIAAAQTRITPPPNKYTPEQDVELGMKAAAEARQQLPVMRDDEVTSYVEDIGQRLVAAIPAEFAARIPLFTSKSSTCARSTRSRCPAGRCSSTAA